MVDQSVSFEVPVVPKVLPVVALRHGVLLPGTTAPFTIGRSSSLAALEAVGEDKLVVVAAQIEPTQDPNPTQLLTIGTLARVGHELGRRDGVRAVLLQGLARVRIETYKRSSPHFEAQFSIIDRSWPEGTRGEAMRRAVLTAVQEIAAELGADQGESVKKAAGALSDPELMVDVMASMLEAELSWKKEVLTTIDPLARAEKVLKQVTLIREVMAAQKSIQDRVRSEIKGNEREAILRKQLKAIQDELGEGDDDEHLARLREKLENADLSEEAREVVDRELTRLSRMQSMSPERSVALDWLGWIADLPWNKTTGTEIELEALEAELERTHLGLKEVKRQVVEHLAVRKLSGHGRADVLLLVGPPGVGKTSIGQAIADASGRKLLRVALGGLRDEAELRGHRRTYIGSRPGRLIEGLRRAGTSDPVILLDEVDKLGHGWQGDPAAALLEILDPEQNHAFVDRYLEVPFDLSRALFIATANDLSTIPGPLRDRMEILEIEGYPRSEKVAIARRHVLKKLAENAGIQEADVAISDRAIEETIAGWTHEAGVRQLQRALGKIFRAAAVKKAKAALEEPLRVDVDDLGEYLGRRRFFDEAHEAPHRPGIATGLAWTPLGGDVLYIEASLVPGHGKLVLTGQLGDVMKESAQAALTYALSHAGKLGIDAKLLETNDIHLHVPSGATPKDGPSAGVTMFTGLASLLSGRPVAGDIAMTGEATLRGRVLPVGGIKSKVLAAHASGLKRVVVPRRNMADLDDVPKQVLGELKVFPVDHMDEVLALALDPLPAVR